MNVKRLHAGGLSLHAIISCLSSLELQKKYNEKQEEGNMANCRGYVSIFIFNLVSLALDLSFTQTPF
jgi:hypothetical protein